MNAPVYSLGNILSDPQLNQFDWSNFSAFWNDLPLDGYMGDGGTYRRRRFSRISYDLGDQNIRPHEDTGFLQSREVNRLNGGVVRRFEPLDPALLKIVIVRRLIAHFTAFIGQQKAPVRTVNIHQHRITATGAESGNPTPEGVHRDGVEHVVMLLVTRTNITGGMSTLYDNAGTPLLNHTLTDPGDYIFLDDRTCMHSTTPVAAAPPAVKGHRDMFFLEFC
jgi:hypothetical protein